MLADIKITYDKIRPHILESPLIFSDWLSNITNGKVYLKMECLQEGKSFKIRGATNALLSKTDYSSVIAASGGNHGLGLAKAAKKLGKPCKIVVPKSTSQYRIKQIEDAGAEVIIHGEAFDEANTFAQDLAKNENGAFVHAFSDIHVMQGQGTVALEILNQIKDPDIILASVGGGGLMGGICSYISELSEEKQPLIYGVETVGADSMYQSFKSGKIVKLDAITSIAGTLGAKETKELNFNIIKSTVKDMLLVTDTEAVIALEEFLDNEKILIEPAASCLIAALKKYPEIFLGKTVVLVICGSNVTLEELENWKKQFNI